jgi:hypothetical protein
MQCPRCDSNRVFRSQARSHRDRVLKSLLPIGLYRCHDCNWRRARFEGGPKAIALRALSLAGYFGGVCLVIVVVAFLLTATLSFFGIRIPWLSETFHSVPE